MKNRENVGISKINRKTIAELSMNFDGTNENLTQSKPG